MIPNAGQRVKIYFRSGLVEEGTVVSWSDKKTVLKSLSSDNLLIIQDTAQDIVAVKIFIHPEDKKQPAPAPVKPNQIYVDKELELPQPERNISLRAMKLAELRLLRVEEEKERARIAMTTFTNHGGLTVDELERYAPPTRLQEPPNFDTAEKNRPRHPRNNR